MENNSKKSHNNLVHFLDEDEIENELTFFEEDDHINDIKSSHILNKNNQFKRRKLFNSISTDNLRKKFNVISSPVSFIPNTSLLNNRNSRQSFTIQSQINNNNNNSRKSNNINSTFAIGIQEANNSNEKDVNKSYIPVYKSFKINTNTDIVSSPVISASSSPICTSTPVAISPQPSTTVPIRSSTPILPPSILRSEGSFSSISSISSINRSRNESSLSSIKEDFNSPEFSSFSQSNENSVNNKNTQNFTSSPISLIQNFSNSSPQLELNDKEENQNIVNVSKKNLYWNSGINSYNSPYLSYKNGLNEKYTVYNPKGSPILKNDNIPQNVLDMSSSSPIPYHKQIKSESSDSELVLFKPIPWKHPLQTTIRENKNVSSNDNNNTNNTPSNNLMITIDQSRDIQNESFNNVNNLSTPVSAILTQKLPLLSLNKSPDKTNNPHLTTSNAIPIPTIQPNSRTDTDSVLLISPLSISMNIDSGLMSNTNSSPTLRKEIEIPYSQDLPRYYGGLSSFSTSPSPITSSALMNGISRNNTELQSNNKYTHNNINIELDKSNYSDLFDYKDDLLSSNSDHHEKDNITTTTNTIDCNINLNTQPLDSMDVDF